MNIINKLTGLVSGVNKATLSGALDVVAVQDDEGIINCTPFHVRFGKLRVFRSSDKIVSIKVNGELIDLEMKLGDAGEGYFIVPRHTLRGLEGDGMVSGDDYEDPDGEIDTAGDASTNSLLGSPARATPARHTGIVGDDPSSAGVVVTTVHRHPSQESDEAKTDAPGADADAGASQAGSDVQHPPIGESAVLDQAGSGGDDSKGGAPGPGEDWEWGWGKLPVRRASELDLAGMGGGNPARASHRRHRRKRKHKRRHKANAERPRDAEAKRDPRPSFGSSADVDEDGRDPRPSFGSSAGFLTDDAGDAMAVDTPRHRDDSHMGARDGANTGTGAGAGAGAGSAQARGARDEATRAQGPSPLALPAPALGAGVQSVTSHTSPQRDQRSPSTRSTPPRQPRTPPTMLNGALPVSDWFRGGGGAAEEGPSASAADGGDIRRSTSARTTPARLHHHRRLGSGGSDAMPSATPTSSLSFSAATRLTPAAAATGPSPAPLAPPTTKRSRSRSFDVRVADVPIGFRRMLPPVASPMPGNVAAGGGSTALSEEEGVRVDMSLCGDAMRGFDDCIVSHVSYAEDPEPILRNPALTFRVIGHTTLLPRCEPDDFTPGGLPVRYLTRDEAAPLLVWLALFPDKSPGARFTGRDEPAAGDDAVAVNMSTPDALSAGVGVTSPRSTGVEAGSTADMGDSSTAASVETPAKQGWLSWLRGGSSATRDQPTPPKLPMSPQSLPPMSPQTPYRPRGDTSTSLQSVSTDSDNESAATFDRSSFRRSLRPTPEQLKSMGLKSGANELEFEVVSGGVQGAVTVSCNLFLWSSNAKIVISDVDGTITKSDVLGHLMYMVGRDWTHEGVARLFTNIKANGYQLLYLTSRAIGQTRQTRTYLQNVAQEDMQLPHGPVITSPDRLFTAFKREVIDRRPETFKISALRDVQNLFPMETNPFYAGFGNRDTDVMAYKSVGIADGKIFIINPMGEIRQIKGNLTYVKSYPALNAMVDTMFPGITDKAIETPHTGVRFGEPVLTDERFNDANFWRVERPLILSDDEDDADGAT